MAKENAGDFFKSLQGGMESYHKAKDKFVGKGAKSKALAKKAGEKIDTRGGMSAGEHNRRALQIERKTGRDYNTGKKIESK